jgi:hypothetical protein
MNFYIAFQRMLDNPLNVSVWLSLNAYLLLFSSHYSRAETSLSLITFSLWIGNKQKIIGDVEQKLHFLSRRNKVCNEAMN